MTKKKSRLEMISSLTWNDLEDWAGGTIVSRGRTYQRQGRVSDLAVTDDGNLGKISKDLRSIFILRF